LNPGDKLLPQGLKFAFVGDNATDWTVYADILTLLKTNGTKGSSDEVIQKSNLIITHISI